MLSKHQIVDFPTCPRGKRVFVSGRTGSGKSWLARWIVERSPGPWVIINPKNTEVFDNFNAVKLYKIDMKKIIKLLGEGFNVNLIPEPIDSHVEVLDAVIFDLISNLENFGVVIDEAYSVHKNGQAMDGLTSLLTRGREKNQSAVICTQRPSRISLFCLSEADYFATMALTRKEDRIKLAEGSGCENFKQRVDGLHEWLWYDVNNDKIRHFLPIPLDNLKI